MFGWPEKDSEVSRSGLICPTVPVIQEEHPLAEWLTGLRSARGVGSRRTVVVEEFQLLGELLADGLVGEHSELFLGSSVTPSLPTALGATRREPPRTFEGSFAMSDNDIVLDDGYRMSLRHYGSAEFHCFDTPTALRVTDAHDLSAYLRDADEAWYSGSFARHITHPNAIVADLAGLGGSAERSGPADRMYVSDAAIRTSPTGSILGTTTETLSAIVARWQLANRTSRYPDATCLGQVVGERDRTDALLERPWIARYLLVVSVIRALRRSHRVADRVSGFGGRLTPGLGGPTAPDDLHAPILLRVGKEYQVHDGDTGARAVVPVGAVATIEKMLTAGGADGPGSAAGSDEVLRLLADAGISEQWRSDIGWE